MTVKTAAAPAQKTFFKSLVMALGAAGATALATAAKAGVGTPRARVMKMEAKAGMAKSLFLMFCMAEYMLSMS